MSIPLLLCSCQKEQVSNTVLNSTTSGTSADAKRWRHHPNGGNNGNGNGSNDNTNFGAMICPPSSQNWLGFQVDVADKLGVTCLRAATLVPATYSVTNLLNADYDIILNFNSDRGDGSNPVPFVSDLNKYQRDLQTILLTYLIKPVIAVIENEESNRFYYSGSASDYIKQLNAAISVMHANGIKVANGGVTSPGLCYLVYQDLLAQGNDDEARRFQQLTNLAPNYPPTQERASFIDELLNAFNQMDLDYVNFHWKGDSPDTEALQDVIDYLKKRCNKPIINNELGQFDNDPKTLTAIMQLCADENLPYAIWYSPDENAGKKDTPLQHSDESLTPSGKAYQDFLEE